ncbi:MAG: xanthine dehydrogenase small subunit [Alphaproteobacteria bacterium]|nr:xanthine dehydrogenase small subunit [Alphaproteobacteria bacterium]
MHLAFLLNGERVDLPDAPPTRTTLDWLREERGLTGSKEGCNEGDCGACTVLLTDADGRTRPLNACILLLPQLHDKALRTIEGLAAPDGTLHPAQQAMIDHHGAQCGFCTPGFTVAMAAAHARGETDLDTAFAGNLCRCTGYAPIARAARAIANAPIPTSIAADARALAEPSLILAEIPRGSGGSAPGPAAAADGFRPRDADDLAAWYAAHPEATLVAGATDLGLHLTKGLRDLGRLAFIAGTPGLSEITPTPEGLRIGAAVTIEDLREALAPRHPGLAELLRRYGSAQVRAAATIGGNIANGSPIGDGPPALIALGATLTLRRGAVRRTLPLEDFFLAYGRQDRAAGEFVEAVTLPPRPGTLHCHKLSKRFDQDISALCGAFLIALEGGRVAAARVAFGGMAGTPRRAPLTEAALIGAPWTEAGIAPALDAIAEDFAPISDLRGSAAYRLEAARGLLRRCLGGDPRPPVLRPIGGEMA